MSRWIEHQHWLHLHQHFRPGGDGVHPLLLWGDLGQLCHLHGVVTKHSNQIVKAKPCLKCQHGHCDQSIDKKRAVNVEWENQQGQLIVFVKGASQGPLPASGETLSLSLLKLKKILNSNSIWIGNKTSCPGRGPCQTSHQTTQMLTSVDTEINSKGWLL